MELPYDSRQVANLLIGVAGQRGDSLSIMRLLKISYMAHGWTLALHDKPLVNDYVQAWRYGPVIPSIYYAFRPYGAYDIEPIPLVKEHSVDDVINSLLAAVYNMYAHLSAKQLSDLTHIKGGPWHATYEPGKRGIIIPNELIKDHFDDKVRRVS